MYNSKRTLEVFDYDLENKKRRSKEELTGFSDKVRPRDMLVVDNCPSCNEERRIKLNQSRKNKPCLKCFHNTPEMQSIKLAQKGKQLTKEHKQKLKENHWSKNGYESAFKGKKHTEGSKQLIAALAEDFFANLDPDLKQQYKIKESCTKRGIPIEEFDGFSAPEGTRLRQSPEGKAWTYDVLKKANFTCVKCGERGGSLHAHHKNGFNLFPDQRFEVDNGACLCEGCHEEFHEKYGRGDNTLEQYNEWKKSDNQYDNGFADAIDGKEPSGNTVQYFAGYEKGFEMSRAVGLNKKT